MTVISTPTADPMPTASTVGKVNMFTGDVRTESMRWLVECPTDTVPLKVGVVAAVLVCVVLALVL